MDAIKAVIAAVLLVAVIGLTEGQDNFQCGIPRARSTFLIIYGESARHGHWPWHVALKLRQKDGVEKYACGGTLISHKFVLTAAHCVLSENRHQLLRSVKDVTIWAGVFNLDQPEETLQVRSVARFHINGYTRDNLLHDIALLETTEPFQYSAHVLPACLNEKSGLQTGLGTVVGWGVSENDQNSPTLKKLVMPVVADTECLRSDPAVFGIATAKELFCAGYANGSAPCNGDSGGGLMVQQGDSWYLAGIVSFTKVRKAGSSLCLAESYTAFTNVTAYWSWIEGVTNIDFRGKFNEERDIPCRTALGTMGNCVPLQQCRDIFNIIRAPIVSQQDAHYINRSICRIAGIPRAVCCQQQHIEPLPLHPNSLLLPSDCGRARVRSSPAAGQSTLVFEFPWMAIVRFKPKRNKIPHCLGTLLNTRYVLSVTGCKQKQKENPIDHVRFGEHAESTTIDCSFDERGRRMCARNVLDVKVERFIEHPQFDVPMYTNDLAIIRLVTDIDYSDQIRPVCLPLYSPSRSNVPLDQIITAWDLDYMTTNIYKGELRRYPERLVDLDVCQKGYEKAGFTPMLSEDRMCALQLGPEYNCQRMAGAPVGTYVNTDGTERFVQFGLWKFAPLNCTVRESVPALAMNLVRYLDWILQNLEPSEKSIIKA
ncbi:hypothetical protein RP20_CCG007567 [Aedes albopictus]|nr:hypothetical protein RP20_CCG007567 [Aedes albopictus]